MSTWIRPALALALMTAVAFAAIAASIIHSAAADPQPRTSVRPAASDSRPRSVLKGLDYLHGRQEPNAGFNTMPNTAWAIMAIAAAGEKPQGTAWKSGTLNPYTWFDSQSHETAATSSDVDNAPVYYARAIMAYAAAHEKDRIYTAGQPRVDLLAKLYSYQTTAEGDFQGAFSPSTANLKRQAVRTTSWALLAMQSVGEDDADRFASGMAWLAKQQHEDGGFSADAGAGESSTVPDTALAVQALTLAAEGVVDPAVLPAARAYLKEQQRTDAGFPAAKGGKTDGQATAAAIQAILALGEQQNDATWTVDGKTPAAALRSLQLDSGGFAKQSGSSLQTLATTAWAMIALRNWPFTTFPASTGSTVTAFVAKPRIPTAAPKNKAVFKASHTVLIKASYNDGDGTGIKKSACRIYVDGVNKSGPADISTSRLSLSMYFANGAHTYKLEIVDHAGNRHTISRTFTVAVPVTPTYAPTTPYPTYTPAPTYPYPTYTPRPTTVSPTPTTTLTPTATASSPFPTSSPSGSTIIGPIISPTPTSSAPSPLPTDGGPSGYVGGALLAMLPIGAALAYLAHRRRVADLEAARHGAEAVAGESAWQQVINVLGGSKGPEGED